MAVESTYVNLAKSFCSAVAALMVVLLVLDAIFEQKLLRRMLYLSAMIFILAHTVYVVEYTIHFRLHAIVLPMMILFSRYSRLTPSSSIISLDLGQLVALLLALSLLKTVREGKALKAG